MPPPVRVVLCTRGGLFGSLVQAHLDACADIDIRAVVRSTRVFAPRSSFVEGAWQFIRRCGWRYAIYLLVATSGSELMCRLADRARKEGGSAGHRPLRIDTRDMNDPGVLACLRSTSPDLLVSAFFDQKLGPEALAIATLGSVNIHPSLLPAFRGVDPVLWAFAAGVDELGVTVHRMTQDFDCGPILRRVPVALPAQDSVFGATARLFLAGTHELLAALPDIRAGTPGTPQTSDGSRYDSWPAPEDVSRVHRLGRPLWTMGGVLRMLRGEWWPPGLSRTRSARSS